MFKKVLIANRGEIACRVMQTCRRLGIKTVAVYSDADRHALHVQLADEAVHIGPAKAAESYLDWKKILAAAKQTGAEAVHPGYGFLSENTEFAKQCQKAGIVFIGPTPEAVELMGSKSAAKSLMEKAGVPVTPGYHGEDQSLKKLEAEAQRIGYPLLIKAVSGGGGKGMRIVNAAGEFKAALEGAQREAQASFGDSHVLLERYIQQPRHIEFQVFGDSHGNVVHLFERECSLQRRFQKVLEETPSPFLDEAMRRKMGEAAVAAAKAVKYVNAGTIEFIVAPDRSFYFMEMNTRLQVEHPITEETTGVDLVEWQLHVAAGGKLPLTQDKIRQTGHAIEVRLYAENPDKGFLPAPGHIELFHPSQAEYVRVDTGVRSGDDIGIFYDPMVAKLTVRAKDREQAIAHLKSALAQTAVFGLTTNLPLLRGIAAHADFAAGKVDTSFIERELKTLLARPRLTPAAVAAALTDELSRLHGGAASAWSADGWRLGGSPGVRFTAREQDGTEHTVTVRGSAAAFSFTLDGSAHEASAAHIGTSAWTVTLGGKIHVAQVLHLGDERQVDLDGVAYDFKLASPFASKAGRVADAATHPLSPMPGRVVAVHVKAGDRVEPGQALMVLEGMKMEYTVKAAVAGTIEKVLFEAGAMVDADAPLAHIKPAD
jgi:3-methylcrotonyl-CoA carboxylase alpha subunit